MPTARARLQDRQEDLSDELRPADWRRLIFWEELSCDADSAVRSATA